MNLLTKVLRARTNIIGTALIAAGSSLLTIFATSGFATFERQSVTPSVLPALSANSALECGDEIYSPVQRKCVSKQVFDAEMKRLFAALGIDASVYSADGETN